MTTDVCSECGEFRDDEEQGCDACATALIVTNYRDRLITLEQALEDFTKVLQADEGPETYEVTYTVVVEVENEDFITDAVRESLDNTGWEPTSVVRLDDDGPYAEDLGRLRNMLAGLPEDRAERQLLSLKIVREAKRIQEATDASPEVRLAAQALIDDTIEDVFGFRPERKDPS